MIRFAGLVTQLGRFPQLAQTAPDINLVGYLQLRLKGRGVLDSRRAEITDALPADHGIGPGQQGRARQPNLLARLVDPGHRREDVGVRGQCGFDQAVQLRIGETLPPAQLDGRPGCRAVAPGIRHLDLRRRRYRLPSRRASGQGHGQQ